MSHTIESAEMGADFITTAIRIPRAVHQLLRQMAVERATRKGGRVSVSGVLAELALERWPDGLPNAAQAPARAPRQGACGAA